MSIRGLSLILAALVLGYSPNTFASRCSVPADIFFDSGSHEISTEQKQRIDAPINQVKRDNTVLAVLVVGHADSAEVPEDEQLSLSQARAKTVVRYVIATYPELKELVYAEGKGATQPLSDKYMAPNRRVSIEVICVVKNYWVPGK